MKFLDESQVQEKKSFEKASAEKRIDKEFGNEL